MAPIPAAAGSVRIHAATMLPATPHRTAESRLAAPEPITAPEIVCVVDSGKPPCDEARITAAPAPQPPRDPVQDEDRDAADDEGERGRHHSGQHDLPDDPLLEEDGVRALG